MFRSGCAARESKVAKIAVAGADEHVQVAVSVEERRCGVTSDVDTVERVVRSRLLDKRGIRDAAGVFEMKNLAVEVPNKRVHVTVAVHVDERRCGVLPTSTPLNGLSVPVCSTKVGFVTLPVFLK